MLKRISEIYQKSKFSRNAAPKVLSLVFAIVFWIFVMDKVNPEMTRTIEDVHIELIGIDELKLKGYEIMGERDFVVDLKINGRRNEVINISKNNIQVTADLGELNKGTQSVILNKNSLADDISIIEMSKSSIKVVIDEIVRWPVNVQIIKQGTVPEGFLDEDMELSLTQVFVKGPESFVKSISSMRGTVSINDETSEIYKDIAITAVDENGETVTGVEVETNYITVKIPISKVENINIQADTVGAIRDGYELTSIEITPNVIRVRGEREIIDGLKFIEITPINISNSNSSFNFNTSIELPDGVTLNENLTEINVFVTIEKVITKEFYFELKDIPFINMKENLRTNKNELNGVVLLRVSGVESIIDEVVKNDLGLYIDAENFEPGLRNITVELNKSNEFSEIEIIPSELELEVYDINKFEEIKIVPGDLEED